MKNKTNRTMPIKIAALIAAIVLVIGCTAGGTVAWLVSKPDPIVNVFTVGNINATLTETKKKREVTVTSTNGDAKVYPINYGAKLRVADGQTVTPGTQLTDGAINPHDLLRILGVRAVQDYELKEVEKAYGVAAVSIADKHIEIIVRQMMRKVKVQDAADTNMLPGSMVDIFAFERENEATILRGGRPATARRVLLGITKASLATESFLSAASFQETTRVLTEAGKLIPAGTGMKRYKDISIREVY